MTEQYLTFKTVPDSETALDFAEVLQQKEIPYLIEEDVLAYDPSYANSQLSRDYLIKIRQEDFEEATKAYQDYFLAHLDLLPADYYLYDFSNQELKEIIAKPDEWGQLDYMLAQKLLDERGASLLAEEKEQLKRTRFLTLAVPDKENTTTIALVYLLSFLLFPVGLLIGWLWRYSEKQLPDGKRMFIYDHTIRQHGKRILIISFAVFLFSLSRLLIRGFF